MYEDIKKEVQLSDMLGVVLARVYTDAEKDATELTFEAVDGRKWKLFHAQDCCEYVYIYDLTGDLADLVGSPITQAVESTNMRAVMDLPDVGGESNTWTFYWFATHKGLVSMRWVGSSNGYYSESVSFALIT